MIASVHTGPELGRFVQKVQKVNNYRMSKAFYEMIGYILRLYKHTLYLNFELFSHRNCLSNILQIEEISIFHSIYYCSSADKELCTKQTYAD